MEESRLRGKGLHCSFVDLKKAFHMVPHEHLWRRMEEFEVPSDYILEFPEYMRRLYVVCV